jgi:hypothetical protein
MTVRLTGLLLAISQLSCSASVLPQCFPLQPRHVGSPLEEIALADAVQRSAPDCDGKERQCALTVKSDSSGAPTVFVEYATILGEDCGYMPGDHELIQYDTKGRFVERVPGV